MNIGLHQLALGLWLAILCGSAAPAGAREDRFQQQIAPLLAARCLDCHNNTHAEAGFSLETRERILAGGDGGQVLVPGKPEESRLWELISDDPPAMPQDQPPLAADEQRLLYDWIAAGAPWPDGYRIQPLAVADLDWWSLRPLHAPDLPAVSAAGAAWARNGLDRFILAGLEARGLTPGAEADRRTLIRRLYFDLIGLPPEFGEVEAFVHDPDPLAYERLVDRLLDSPHYGERWARHWMDVVHYGDTHGYDKDQPRPNAWPYRDYLIRSFNEDKPYGRFVMEQIAGDMLWPGTRDGIEATGFIAAGPWDLIGHAEVPETKLDGRVARNLDRDDMVSSTMNTFISMTVQCARCHNHKFDPVTQQHYYSLQAVFAALDRTDREYDPDPAIARERSGLLAQLAALELRQETLQQQLRVAGGEALAEIESALAQLAAAPSPAGHPAFGYHSQISAVPDQTKWVQVDLGQSRVVREVVLSACHDDFGGIGAGFGFPVRFRIEASDAADFSSGVILIADHSAADFPNPRLQPLVVPVREELSFRYLRITATRLAHRTDDYILALGELELRDPAGTNLALGQPVTALDSIEMPPRWQAVNLVDGLAVREEPAQQARELSAGLASQRAAILEKVTTPEVREEERRLEEQLAGTRVRLAALPPPARVYCGAIHSGSGAFAGTGANGGQPREIRILGRGDLQSPGALVGPGTVPVIPGVDWQFDLPPSHTEGERRVALAEWLVRPDHPLTWRSIVNRIWLYHFGRGLVDSPNDFGRMGELPSHPELLDWLAAGFRDGDQSLKSLHRMMVTSSTYRQDSADRAVGVEQDADNRLYWKMNRRLLDAEAIRDACLSVSGRLDRKLYGPPFQDFVIDRPEHSPHYEYHLHDPLDPLSHRRSIYRMIVRSQQQPFLQTLDCADPSESVARRNTSLTSLQALTLLNNRFMIAMAGCLAERAEAESPALREQAAFAFRAALGRQPAPDELDELTGLARQSGLANACRAILNLNEFVFVD